MTQIPDSMLRAICGAGRVNGFTPESVDMEDAGQIVFERRLWRMLGDGIDQLVVTFDLPRGDVAFARLVGRGHSFVGSRQRIHFRDEHPFDFIDRLIQQMEAPIEAAGRMQG